MALCIVAGLLFLISLWLRYKEGQSVPFPIHLVCTSLVLMLALLLIRFTMLGFQWLSLSYSYILLPYTLAAGFYDLFYLAAITTLFLLLLWLTTYKKWLQRIVYGIYIIIACISLAYSLINMQAIYSLGHPLTYSDLVGSNFLQDPPIVALVAENIAWSNGTAIGVAIVALLAMSTFLAYVAMPIVRFSPALWWRVLPVVALIFYFSCTNPLIVQNGWAYARLANPVVVFVQSLFDNQAQAHLLR
jgi:hypothetical protein